MTEIDKTDLHEETVGMSRMQIDHLLSRSILARIATTGLDMQPHVVPVWFWWDGTNMFIETGKGFRKARNLLENPLCSLIIDDTQGGLRFWGIFLLRKVELITEPVEWVQEMVERIYLKYLGSEGVQAPTPRSMIDAKHVIIKFTPERIITWDETRSAIAPID